MIGGRLLSGTVFAIAFGGALWRAQPPAPPEFSVAAPAPPAIQAEYRDATLPASAPSVHAASLAQLPDGRLAMAWFGGSREGAGDVAIWLAVENEERRGWNPPRRIATRAQFAQSTRSYIRKLGNPVLFVRGSRLHLWVVSAGIGGWAGSAINACFSDDGGESWSAPHRLVTSAFLNIGTLVRTPPLALSGGGIGLPAYHEFLSKHGEWLELDAAGRIVRKSRIPAQAPTLQPAVVALSGREALAAMRDASPSAGRVRMARTHDGGLNWEAGQDLPVDNPNSSLALLRLPSGRFLLAGNPSTGRRILQLWLSDPQGRHWRLARTIERSDDESAEFSYPALLLDREGRIHMAWTWQRRLIRHAVFTEPWVERGP